MPIQKVLIVCQENTCLGPMFETRLKNDLNNLGVTDITVESAGTQQETKGEPANEHAFRCMLDRGLQIDGHRSRFVGDLEVMTFDLIVCLDPEAYLSLRAHTNGKDVVQKNLANPFGLGLEAYRHCAAEIDELSSEIARFLKNERELETSLA